MRFKFFSVFFSTLAFLCCPARGDMMSCIRQVGGGLFDLTAMSSDQDIIINDVAQDVFLEFNVCEFTDKQCNTDSTFANLFSSKDDDCIELSNTTRYQGITYSLIDPQQVSGGIQILFSGGDVITTTIDDWSPVSTDDMNANPNSTYNFALDLFCNKDVETYDVLSWNFDNTSYTYYVSMQSSHACPLLTLDDISQFFSDYRVIFALSGAALGCVFAIFGLKLFVPTLFIIGFVSGFFIALFIFFSIWPTLESFKIFKWVLVVLSIACGVGIGYVTVKANKLGIFALGNWLGITLSLLLYNAFLYKIPSNPAGLVFWITIIVLGTAGGFLALRLYKYFVIISTSFIGAYGFVRSLSLLIGYFPNENELIQEIQLQDYELLTHWTFYIYMTVILLLTAVCVFIQHKIEKRRQEKEVDENDYEEEYLNHIYKKI